MEESLWPVMMTIVASKTLASPLICLQGNKSEERLTRLGTSRRLLYRETISHHLQTRVIQPTAYGKETLAAYRYIAQRLLNELKPTMK